MRNHEMVALQFLIRKILKFSVKLIYQSNRWLVTIFETLKS